MTTATWAVLLVAAAAIIVVVLFAVKERRTKQLRSWFGPEYDRVVHERGNVMRAERELDRRVNRVENFHIHQLTREECYRFATEWRGLQERFVDDPEGSVAAADELVQRTMKARGYPVGDFEERAADLSVDHPRVVEHYRAAHDIALRDAQKEASTEDLRIAFRHYRELFEELIDAHDVSLQEVNYEHNR